jgi:hypothetical protein
MLPNLPLLMKHTLNKFQTLELPNTIAANLREFVLSLLHKPAVFGTSKNLGRQAAVKSRALEAYAAN